MKTSTTVDGIHYVRFGEKVIPYKLEFKDRIRLSISVHPNQTVTVIAPENRSLEEVQARVEKRSAWIYKQLDYFEQFNPLPHEQRFISGETHLYLGRHYRLKVQESCENSVKMKGRFFVIKTSSQSRSKGPKELLTKWYRDHATNIFQARLEKCLEDAHLLKLPTPSIIIRRMSTRWGSCTKTGNILLNLELVKAPLYCIEYVIMHELCHLRIHNHSSEFYRLLSRVMPDWERRKKRLDSILI